MAREARISSSVTVVVAPEAREPRALRKEARISSAVTVATAAAGCLVYGLAAGPGTDRVDAFVLAGLGVLVSLAMFAGARRRAAVPAPARASPGPAARFLAAVAGGLAGVLAFVILAIIMNAVLDRVDPEPSPADIWGGGWQAGPARMTWLGVSDGLLIACTLVGMGVGSLLARRRAEDSPAPAAG